MQTLRVFCYGGLGIFLFVSLFSLVFLAILWFELKAWHLLGRCSTTWAMTPALFGLVIFHIGSCIYTQSSLDYYPSIYDSCIAGMSAVCHHAQVLVIWNRVLQPFCLVWPWITVLLILASQVLTPILSSMDMLRVLILQPMSMSCLSIYL
jgi:hypothetical protein